MAELFTTNPVALSSLLSDVENAYIQLPDFQRGWVWDEERIQNLLVSIIKKFPIGAIMMLKAGSENAKFKSIPLHNVQQSNTAKTLLLDGQQRLTSLYQALRFTGAVDTCDVRKKELKRFFYFNINEIIKDDIDGDEAVIIVNEQKFSRKTGTVEAYDYTTTELECEHDLFPANLSLDMSAVISWGLVYTKNGSDIGKNQKWQQFMTKIVEVASYNIPVISLTEDNKKEAVCSVFENVNTGGVPLNVFELLTATFAADGYTLRQIWENEISVALKDNNQDYNKVLRNVSNVDFLQSLTLLATHKRANQAVACKKKHILELTLEEFQDNYVAIQNGFIEAGRFLLMQHIYSHRGLPYGTQLVPLATIFAHLGRSATTAKSFDKITCWYWNGVFGELYGGANETRYVKDFVEMSKWIADDSAEQPETIKISSFRADRLDEMRTKNSAAYKGLAALLLKNGAKDFYRGYAIDNIVSYNSANIDIHHIFPKSYCEKQGIPSHLYDSIVNKAPISYDTNRSIGGSAPSVYLAKLDADNGASKTDEQLVSQLIDPSSIRADNFDGYYADRKQKLVKLIENTTGKAAV